MKRESISRHTTVDLHWEMDKKHAQSNGKSMFLRTSVIGWLRLRTLKNSLIRFARWLYRSLCVWEIHADAVWQWENEQSQRREVDLRWTVRSSLADRSGHRALTVMLWLALGSCLNQNAQTHPKLWPDSSRLENRLKINVKGQLQLNWPLTLP